MNELLKKFLDLKNKNISMQTKVETRNAANDCHATFSVKDQNATTTKAISEITLPDNLPGCNFICANGDGEIKTFDLITEFNTNIANQINNILIPSINTTIDEATASCDNISSLEDAIIANTNAITNINLIIGASSRDGLQGRILDLEDLVNTLKNQLIDINDALGNLDYQTLGTIANRIIALEECCENCATRDCSYTVDIPEQTISFIIPAQTVHTSIETCTSTPL